MGLDCDDLVRDRTDRCHTKCFRHARGGHAPQLGGPVLYAAAGVGALGPGNSTGTAAWPQIPYRAVAATSCVDRSPQCLCCHRPDFVAVENLSRGTAEPVGAGSGAASVSISLVQQLLWWTSFVSNPVLRHSSGRPRSRIAGTTGAPANGNRSSERATLQGAA